MSEVKLAVDADLIADVRDAVMAKYGFGPEEAAKVEKIIVHLVEGGMTDREALMQKMLAPSARRGTRPAHLAQRTSD